MTYDVVIIGSGLGGLACAALLSRLGKSVLVLEQARQVGGCMQSYSRGGHTLDTGFHYVGGLAEGQSLHSAFRLLGLLSLPWQRLDPDGFDCVTIGGHTFRYAEGYDEFAHRMTGYFPKERAAIAAFVELMRHSAEAQYDALRPRPIHAGLSERLVQTGAWPYMKETFSDPLLIDALSGSSLKMELRRESLPLFTLLHTLGGFVESSWRLRGDGSLIAYRLADEIRGNGGEIVCGARVVELTEKAGRVDSAVCADGETYAGRTFISDIHPSLTCDLLAKSGAMRRAYRNRIARLENTAGMCTVSLSVPQNRLRYFNHNHFVYRHADVWAVGDAPSERVDAVMISCRCPADGDSHAQQVDLLTPSPLTLWHEWADTTVGRRGYIYNKVKTDVACRCLELACTQVSELHDATTLAVSTPLTWHDYTLTPCGTAYGVRKDYRQPLLTMLSPRTPISNLLLTGQSLALHGLQGVTMTALATCAEVVGKETIWNMIT